MTTAETETRRYRQAPAPGGRPNRIRVQLTDEQLQALQRLSEQRQVGIQQLLLEAVFHPAKLDPRVLMREVAGVRRILTEEREQLIGLTQQRPVPSDVWEQVTSTLGWRDLQLQELYQWR